MGWKNDSSYIYSALNPMSKIILVTAAGGIIMGRPAVKARKLLYDMQENHSQWHVERSTTRKVSSISEEKMKSWPPRSMN